MKLRSKETYWLLKNGLLHTYPSLRKDLTCDVLIIGGGITGSLIAYQLSKEGYRSVLIDKRDIAMGSTGATTAMLQYEIDEPLHTLIDKVGEHAAVDSYREGILAIDKIEKIVKRIGARCGFKQKQSLYIADTKKNLKWLRKEFTCRKKFKLGVSWLNRSQLKKQFGMIGEGAIVSKAGASLDAYHLAHALLAYSARHFGLRVFDHTSAETVETVNGYNKVTTDDRFVIGCKHIVYASGYETQQILKKNIVNLNSTYAFVSEPLLRIPAALQNSIFWNTENPYLYMRCTSDNRILVGGGDEGFKNANRRDRLIDRKETFLLESIKKLLPELTLIPDFTWAGTFGVTKDALPYIGPHPDFPNSYFVLGFGGNGITFSVMGMSIISDALAGRENKFLQYFSLTR
jgi:glycine/D-amino acid oxidase-like deaminating enzyme